MAAYALYKQPTDHSIIHIIQFLHSQGHTYLPRAIVERAFPIQITKLPAIYDINAKKLYFGNTECVKFFEKYTKIKKIEKKTKEFKEKNPEYAM
jgi:hypothetical protein